MIHTNINISTHSHTQICVILGLCLMFRGNWKLGLVPTSRAILQLVSSRTPGVFAFKSLPSVLSLDVPTPYPLIFNVQPTLSIIRTHCITYHTTLPFQFPLSPPFRHLFRILRHLLVTFSTIFSCGHATL